MNSQVFENGFRAEHGLPGHMRGTTEIRLLEHNIVKITRGMKYDLPLKEKDYILSLGPGNGKVSETERTYEIGNDVIRVQLDRDTGAICFMTGEGKVLLKAPEIRMQEKPVILYEYSDEEVVYEESIDGVRARTRRGTPVTDRIGLNARQTFLLDEDEAVYGLGSHEEGYGNLRGKTRNLYQQNMKACVPALVSTRGWELVFAMGGLISWSDSGDGAAVWVECADSYEFYFLYGDGSYQSIMPLYAALTGTTPLLPASAMGYIQSKERYKDAEELIATVAEYRRREVPLDVIVLDWQSWPEGQWGYKVFDTTRFPDPAAMTEKLHEMGASMMISIWPSMVGDANRNRDEMLEHGYMLGNRTIYNAFKPEARKLYWKQARDGLFRYGIDAWWCDCTEPFEADWHGSVKMEEHERVTANTDEARKYFDPTELSTYSFHHSRGIWEGQRAETDRKRVFNLTRSSWTGQHRYGTVTWSGDTAATWKTLRNQIPEGMNFCATGEAYWTNDAGAFFVRNGEPWFYCGDYDDGVDDPGYRELYTRWMQYAAFLPLMRSHGTDTPREIWQFGEKGTPYYDAIEKAIRIRYKLFPYLYSLMGETWKNGMPMMRVPALMFPEDKALRDARYEMMLGDALLVRPVTEPDCKETEVILPAGCEWYDLFTGERFAGGQTIRVHVTLDTIPVFIRGGSILPTVPVCRNTGEAAKAPLTLTVVPGADASFTLYEDTGDSYDYEKGQYSRTLLHWDDAQKTLSMEKEDTGWMPPEREIRVRIFGTDREMLIPGENGPCRF